MRRPIRVLSFMEATEVTGPARNMLRFAALASKADVGNRALMSFATFCRATAKISGSEARRTPFESAGSRAGLDVDVIDERFVYDPRVIRAMQELIDDRGPDVIQSHGVKGHFLMRWIQLSHKQRWIAFHHGYTSPNFKMRLYNQLDRWSLRKADLAVTVCDAFAGELTRKGVAPDRVKVLQNSIEGEPEWTEDEVKGLRRELQLGEEHAVVVAIGRLSAEKAHRDLLHAAAKLKAMSTGRSVRLVIVGDGPERARLEELTAKLNLTEGVVFAGYRQRPGPFLRIADVFALPSHSEGSPNALLEAMAAGTPAVATRVGGVPDMIEDQISGLIVPFGRPQELADALARLLTDRALAAGLAATAKEAISTRFTPAAYRDRLLSIYRQLLDAPSPVR